MEVTPHEEELWCPVTGVQYPAPALWIHCGTMDSGSFGLLLYGSRRWGMSGGCRWMRLRGGFPSHQVVTYAFGDKHCFRNYALQDCGLFI